MPTHRPQAIVFVLVCFVSQAYCTWTGSNTLHIRSPHSARRAEPSAAVGGHVGRLGRTQHRIPRTLHQIYLEGEDTFQERAKEGQFSKEHRESCQRHHQHWDYVLWTKEKGEQLVMEDFPWFWNTWSNYTHWVSLLP